MAMKEAGLTANFKVETLRLDQLKIVDKYVPGHLKGEDNTMEETEHE